jgi:hypothetical protein
MTETEIAAANREIRDEIKEQEKAHYPKPAERRARLADYELHYQQHPEDLGENDPTL